MTIISATTPMRVHVIENNATLVCAKSLAHSVFSGRATEEFSVMKKDLRGLHHSGHTITEGLIGGNIGEEDD